MKLKKPSYKRNYLSYDLMLDLTTCLTDATLVEVRGIGPRSPGCLLVRHSSEPGRAFRPGNKHKRKEAKKMNKSNRVTGLDVHPDSFTGAVLLKGKDAASARVVSTSRRVELPELEKWVARHTGEQDGLVLEASGNAFAVAERLRVLQRQVVILDSHRAGKVGKAYCANDRVDAIKVARIYLTALSPVVWQPDAKVRDRRAS